MKLGSLFDGSGTAPLAAELNGIEAVWCSEVEPYPIRVTKQWFPKMKHLGDITKIHGDEVEPVDIICGGSPCQDLSVAGKRSGLQDGKRSHLFYEMTRIIQEMRNKTNGKYPRYIIWENVTGAFSSNNGYDFLSVLQSFAEIADPNVYVPEPTRGGQNKLDWTHSGEIFGNGFSIAWRTVDAQYWGVPQRRRRIYLVASYSRVSDCSSTDETIRHSSISGAGEVLFERKSLSWNTEQSGEARQATSKDVKGCAYGGHSGGGSK